MAGTTATTPVPALNDALPTLDTRGSALASHGLEAHLQVTYHEVKGTSGYAIAALMRPDAPCAPFHSLQVSRIEAVGADQRIEFNYGKVPGLHPAGLSFAPTVLREIVLPARTLRLDWEGSPSPPLNSTRRPESWSPSRAS